MLSLDYSIDKNIVSKMAAVHRKTYRWTMIRPFLAIALILTGVFVWYTHGDKVFSIVQILLSTYLMFSNFIYEKRLTKQLCKTMCGDFNLEILENKIIVSAEKSNGEMDMSAIATVVEQKDFLMFYLSRISFFGIPKSAFKSDEDIDNFIGMFPNIPPEKL